MKRLRREDGSNKIARMGEKAKREMLNAKVRREVTIHVLCFAKRTSESASSLEPLGDGVANI